MSNRAGSRRAGALGRLLVWCPSQANDGIPSNQYSLNFSGLEQGWQTFLRMHTQNEDNFQKILLGPRCVGALGRLLVWCPSQANDGIPSNQYSLNFSGLEQGWQTFLRMHTQNEDNFQEILSCMENLNLQAPHL